MGRPMGIPKTGVFGLYDLIGIDLMADVVRSLRSTLPAEDAFQAVGAENELINAMIAAGYTGQKGLGGFYCVDNGQSMAKDLATGNYRARQAALPARAIKAAASIAEQREALTDLVAGDDNEAKFCRHFLGRVLGYAASLLGDVTESPQAIDDAMKLGFNWVRGPFEMIDALGADKVAAFLTEIHAEVPPALQWNKPFYSVDENTRTLNVLQADQSVQAVALPDGVMRLHLYKRCLTPAHSNAAASVYQLDDDIRLVEFHSKANALTDASMAMVMAAANDHGSAIVVHNDAQHYSAGVDLNAFLAMINAADWDGIDAFLARFQAAVKALKYSPVPVVGAPSGLSLGGGCEVLLHCDQLVMHSNVVIGLVESGVGLIPAGGGVKETYWRWYQQLGNWEEAAWKTWMNIGYGRTATSPMLAQRLNYFLPKLDTEVINRDRLLSTALQTAQSLRAGYKAPTPPSFMLAGGDILQRMQAFMDDGVTKGHFTAHNSRVAMEVASIVCAADGEACSASEDDLYRREREAFIRLAKTEKTRARIEHLLAGKGALQN